MATIIVTTDDGPHPMVLLAEQVQPCHMADEHCSLQIIERIAWAVEDAESLRPLIAARREAA